jgi:hypothetical protein
MINWKGLEENGSGLVLRNYVIFLERLTENTIKLRMAGLLVEI